MSFSFLTGLQRCLLTTQIIIKKEKKQQQQPGETFLGWKYNSPLRKTCCTLLTIVSIRLSQRALLLLQPPHPPRFSKALHTAFRRQSPCLSVEPVALQLSRYVDTGALPGGAVPAVGPPGWSKAKSKADELGFFCCFGFF